MNLLIDGKPVTLASWQLEKLLQEQKRLVTEERAQALLYEYLNAPANQDENDPSLFTVHNPRHIDYLADRVAECFLKKHRETVTDASVWKQSIRQVLAAHRKGMAALPEHSEYGSWLLRPFDALLRLMWRCQYDMSEIDFCLDERISGMPRMPYHVSFSNSDGLLYFHLKSPVSGLLHLLDDGTQRSCSYEDFVQAVRALLAEDLKHQGRKLPKYFWVHE